MAITPVPVIDFIDSCRDCAKRTVSLPAPVPEIGDDFDWLSRDYDGFRLMMMEELAGRFPERTRWTPADLEVILVEALSVVLDQLSDTLDRVHQEAYLDSARQPQSVRRLLKLIGYDAVRVHYRTNWSSSEVIKHILTFKQIDISSIGFSLDLSQSKNIKKLLQWLGHDAEVLGGNPSLSNPTTEQQLLALLGYDTSSLFETIDLSIPEHRLFAIEQLERQWRDNAHAMEQARVAGPRALHTNKRMVTLDDYRERIEDHPLVLRATSGQKWTGSWNTIELTTVLLNNAQLDESIETAITGPALAEVQRQVNDFHWANDIAPVDWGSAVTFRRLLKSLIDRLRMAGQEVWLQDAIPVGISISLSIRVASNYFQSEISQAVASAMSNHVQGFFSPGRLAFGENLYASDLIEWLMTIEGIEAVCLNRFKRVGQRYRDESGTGVIRLSGNQIARCDNAMQQPQYGYWTQSLHGGQRG